MICKNCGKKIPNSAKVCGYCGTKQESQKIQAVTASVEPTPKAKGKPAAQKEAVAAPADLGQPKKSKKAAWWIIPLIVAVLAAAALGAYFLFFAGPSEDQMTYVYWNCEPTIVSAGQPVAVYYYWMAADETQLDDYFKAASHSVTVNGKDVAIKKHGIGLTEKAENGVKRRYWMYIGKLQPGNYELATTLVIREKVFDGADWSGPGTSFPGVTRYCSLRVE